MPLFTPTRKQTCPSCSAELEAKVEQNLKLFAEVNDKVTCPGCKTRLSWRPEPFFYQDLAVALFGGALAFIEFPAIGAVVLIAALICFYHGERTMKLEAGQPQGTHARASRSTQTAK